MAVVVAVVNSTRRYFSWKGCRLWPECALKLLSCRTKTRGRNFRYGFIRCSYGISSLMMRLTVQERMLLPPLNRSHIYIFPGSVRQVHPEMDAAISILLKSDHSAVVSAVSFLVSCPPASDMSSWLACSLARCSRSCSPLPSWAETCCPLYTSPLDTTSCTPSCPFPPWPSCEHA
jgi:hypothetical protein